MNNQNLKLRFHLIKRVVITYMPYTGSTISIDISDSGPILVNDNGICKSYPGMGINEQILHDALKNVFLEELEASGNGKKENISWKVEFYNKRRLDHIAYGTDKTALYLWDSFLWVLYSIERYTGADLGLKHLRSFYETKKEDNGNPAVASDQLRTVYYQIMNSLLARISEKNSDHNIMISPLSLMYVVSILIEAAEGVTREELENIFDRKYSEIVTDLSALIQDSSRTLSQLRIANALYVDNELLDRISESYLQSIAEKYYTDRISAGFGTISESVNEWVDRKTHGMIKRMLNDEDRLNEIAVLNALVFEAKWLDPYEEEDIEPDVFHNEDGTESAVSMLCSAESRLLINSKVIGFFKPYLGSEYYYAGLLPNQGYTVTQILKEMTPDEWQLLFERSRKADVRVKIPEYQFQYECDLSSIMAELGVTTIFNPKLAHLNNMLPVGEVYIDKVLQKTFIDVNRKGTRAAAVTGLIAASGHSPYETYEVHLDRPFIFAVFHKGSGVPVFIGTVMNLKTF